MTHDQGATSDVLRLRHDARAAGRARRWLVERCDAWDCEELSDSAALLVSELVTNVFLHARTDCVVRADLDPPVLTVAISDGDIRELQPSASPDSSDVGGRGLAIVAELAAAWGVHYGESTKSVWFQLERGVQQSS